MGTSLVAEAGISQRAMRPDPYSQRKPNPPDLQICDLYKSRRPVEFYFRNLMYRDFGRWCRHSRRLCRQRLITQKNYAVAILKRQRANSLPTDN